MGRVAIAVLALLLLLPGAAVAKTVTYKGKVASGGAVKFDVVLQRGKPKAIKNVGFTNLFYVCGNGNLTRSHIPYWPKPIPVNAKRGFRYRETRLPPDHHTSIKGRFRGKGSPRATGQMFDEWGYGGAISTYNCTTASEWKAKRVP